MVIHSDKDLLSVSNSILLGSVIISAAILFSSAPGVGTASLGSQAAGNAAPQVVKVESRGDAPKEGNGKVVVEAFSDFQCPFCKSFTEAAYKDIKAKYIDTGKITFIFRHYPLSFHVNAQKAGEAAECANRQGKFWQYHDVLFANGQSDGKGLEVANLKSYAADLGLDTAVFNKCLDGGETSAIIKADFAAGQRAGVTGTPTFFINGEKLVGAQPFVNFETAIESKLK